MLRAFDQRPLHESLRQVCPGVRAEPACGVKPAVRRPVNRIRLVFVGSVGQPVRREDFRTRPGPGSIVGFEQKSMLNHSFAARMAPPHRPPLGGPLRRYCVKPIFRNSGRVKRPYPYEPCDDGDPMPDYENVLTD